MSSQTFTKGALTGGTSGCLDAIDGDDVNNGDRAMVVTADAAYFYVMNSTSGASEDSPEIISPDTNAGDKRWILKGVCASADISLMNWIVDEDAMTSDSATKVPTQQSVKAYVDNLIVDEDDMTSDSAALVPTQQSVKAYVDSSTASGLSNVSEDTSPEVGGDLYFNDAGSTSYKAIFIDGTYQSSFYQVGADTTYRCSDHASAGFRIRNYAGTIEMHFRGDGTQSHDVTPSITNVYSLGSTLLRWKKGWMVDLTTTNAPATDSDERIKENINPIADKYISLIQQLEPVNFALKADENKKTHTGLIAQQVLAIIDNLEIDNTALVREDENGMLAIAYGELIAPMIKIIQDLTKRVEKLEKA